MHPLRRLAVRVGECSGGQQLRGETAIEERVLGCDTEPMSVPAVEQLRAAYESLNSGDPDPLAALFRPDAVWRGIERGRLWWKKAPS